MTTPRTLVSVLLAGAALVPVALVPVAHARERRDPARPPDAYTAVVASLHGAAPRPVSGSDDGACHVVYELVLSNASRIGATLQRLQVVDAARAQVIADFDADALLGRLRTLSNRAAGSLDVAPDTTRLLLVELAFPSCDATPRRLEHRLYALAAAGPASAVPAPTSSTVASFELARRGVPRLGPPLAGDGWVALNGCCDTLGAHRATALPVNGELHLAQRFAIDWMQLDGAGKLVHGNGTHVEDYPGYGKPVLAVADAVVVEALDELDDQVPPNLPDPSTITIATVDGNHVVLDLGDGLFAFYAHLRRGSVRVSSGDRVSRGDVLGELGNSGNTSAPHLHFHVMDGRSTTGSEGRPYVLDRFRLAGQAREFEDVFHDFSGDLFARPEERRRQLPTDLAIVDLE